MGQIGIGDGIMELSELFFTMMYNIVCSQNMYLLHEIAIREKLPVQSLMKEFKPKRKDLNHFLRQTTVASASGE
jgi:hypothetical protein